MTGAIRRYLAALINPDPAGKVRYYTKGGERNYVHDEYAAERIPDGNVCVDARDLSDANIAWLISEREIGYPGDEISIRVARAELERREAAQ